MRRCWLAWSCSLKISANRSGCELTTKFVLDVNPDNVVKGLFGGGEAETERPLRLEIARPAGDNAHDERVRLAFDPRRDLFPCHPPPRRDLLPGRPGNPAPGESAAPGDP